MKVRATLFDKDGNVIQVVEKTEARDFPLVGSLNAVGLHGKIILTNEGV